MSIKIGDYITIKDNMGEAIAARGLGYKYPLLVEKITKCDVVSHICCKECPGTINANTCFGHIDKGYMVKPINRDWDE